MPLISQGRLGRDTRGRTCACLEQNRRRDGGALESVAVAESWGNGKPVRETLAAAHYRSPLTTSATLPARSAQTGGDLRN